MDQTSPEQVADPAPHFRATVARFGFAEGGPVDALFDRLGRLGAAAESAPLRAGLVLALVWVVPLVLNMLAGTAWGTKADEPFLRDWAAWSRLAIAAPLLILLDRHIDERLRVYLNQFADAPLIAPTALTQAAEAVVRMIDVGRAPLALVLCGVVAFLLSISGVFVVDLGERSLWLTVGRPEPSGLSMAGWWLVLVSGPLFWFLLLRALWRYLCWAMLLRRLARLPLRLTVAHPDGVGGLGFLGSYPNAFTALVFAMGASMAGVVAHALDAGTLSVEAYGALLSGWLAVVAAMFAVPLSAFSKPLRRLREATLLAAAAQGTRRSRADERAVLGRNLAAGEDAEEVAPGDVPDPGKLHAAAKKLGTMPFDRAAILPLAVAAMAPLLAAGATRLPFNEILSVAKKLLLI